MERIEYSCRPVVGSWNVQSVFPVAGSSDTIVRRGPETVMSSLKAWASRSLARALLSSPLGPTAAPFFHLARLTTVGLLPPAIREGYGFGWDARKEKRLRRAAAVVRSVRPYMPAFVREWPAARGAPDVALL